MEIKEEKRGDVKIVGLHGRLDAETSPSVEKWLMDLLGQGERRSRSRFLGADLHQQLRPAVTDSSGQKFAQDQWKARPGRSQ